MAAYVVPNAVDYIPLLSFRNVGLQSVLFDGLINVAGFGKIVNGKIDLKDETGKTLKELL